jgi:hypothetical protein
MKYIKPIHSNSMRREYTMYASSKSKARAEAVGSCCQDFSNKDLLVDNTLYILTVNSEYNELPAAFGTGCVKVSASLFKFSDYKKYFIRSQLRMFAVSIAISLISGTFFGMFICYAIWR